MTKALPDKSGYYKVVPIGPRTYSAVAILILIVATILRLIHLGETSLWVDEAIYANSARTTLQDLIETTRHGNSTPIGLPLLLFVIEKFSVSPWIVRLPSVIFSVSAIGIILALPRVGITRGYCLAIAAVMAVSTAQIRYAQEVREYALSVFAVAVMLYFWFKYLDNNSTKNLAALTTATAVAPFLAYGSCFAALAVIVSLAIIHSDQKSKRLFFNLLIIISTFAIAATVSWVTIAKYQAYVTSADYLMPAYPPAIAGSKAVWIARSLKWLTQSFKDYIAFHFVGQDTAILFILIIAVSISQFVYKPEQLKREPALLLFVILLGGSVVAAFLRLYPFGGIRQQLFAAPIVILAVVRAGAQLYSQIDSRWRRLILFWIIAITLARAAVQLPTVYGEREDIRSAVTRGLQDANPNNVYVYYGAIPALDFHFPNSGFRRGTLLRGYIAAMADEAIRVASDGQLYLLFSHIYVHEDDLLIAELRARGWTVVRDQQYAGARAVYLTKTPEQ
jgi:hypothetical protein